jgi:hypothetical protein
MPEIVLDGADQCSRLASDALAGDAPAPFDGRICRRQLRQRLRSSSCVSTSITASVDRSPGTRTERNSCSGIGAGVDFRLIHLGIALDRTAQPLAHVTGLRLKGYRRAVRSIRARVEASPAIRWSFVTALRVSAVVPAFRWPTISCSSPLISLMLSFIGASPLKKRYGSGMSTFDYTASAELFAAQGRSGLRYRRFTRAAEAIKYAIEKLPPKVLAATSLEVDDERYSAGQIRTLYDSQNYPLVRARPSP